MDRAVHRSGRRRDVFPCAGPPCFLDPICSRSTTSIAIPPTSSRPACVPRALGAAGIDNALVVPGSVVDLTAATVRSAIPTRRGASRSPATSAPTWCSTNATGRLASERARKLGAPPRLGEGGRRGSSRLERAPITSAGIAGNVVIDVGANDANLCIDFVESQVRVWRGEPYVYKVDVDRALIEALVDDHVEDWVNSLFLSCRFTAHRDGPFNEFVMTFFKALSPERIAYVERCHRAVRRRTDEFFERDGWRIERWCPHRQADLTRFGEIADGVLTCSLHHWRFDRDRSLPDQRRPPLRCERAGPTDTACQDSNRTGQDSQGRSAGPTVHVDPHGDRGPEVEAA
jgi:UDP-MurNAc hydroxylase